MKLHAPFLILAKAATQPAALPYQHGRTATGFSAARCHRAALPSCSGRPAARSGAEERKARRGTRAPGSCALLAAPHRKPAPADSPLRPPPSPHSAPAGTRRLLGRSHARALRKGLLRNTTATRSPPNPPATGPAAAAAATRKSGPPPPPAGVMAARGQWPAAGGAAGGSLRLPGPSLTATAVAAQAADVTAGCRAHRAAGESVA